MKYENPITQTAADEGHRVVPESEWLKERRALLEQEKEHTKMWDQLLARRHSLPW
ncbi:MAG: DUF899 domain-containing protein [Acidobacteriota bacterium]|nr:DUF899 domain-containing protein [Acidobacteriota bacterium]